MLPSGLNQSYSDLDSKSKEISDVKDLGSVCSLEIIL